MNPYEVLGLHKGATDGEVRVAHRRLAKLNHPDAGGDPDDFRDIQTAYEILIDPARRARFNETGETEEPKDTTDAEVLQAAISAFVEVMQRVTDVKRHDLPKLIRKVLREKQLSILAQRQQVENDLSNASDTLARLKPGTGPDPIGGFLRSEIAKMSRAIEQADYSIDIFERARKLVQAYTFERDIAPAPVSHGIYTTTSTGW